MFAGQLPEIKRFFLKNARRISVVAILGFVALSVVMGASLSKLHTEYSMRQFLPPHHKLMDIDDAVKERFQISQLEPFFALITLPESEKGTWLEEGRIEKLRQVTESLRNLEAVDRTFSIATMEGASSTKEGLTVGRLLALTPKEKWAERILNDPVLTPNLITKDARTILLAVGIKEGTSTSRSAQIQLAARKELHEAFAGATVRLGGIPAVQTEISTILSSELRNFLWLSLLASIFTLALFFRSISSIFTTLFLMIVANLVSLGWMALTGVAFTVLSTTLPVLVALTVVSMSAHTMLRYAADWEHAKKTLENPNPYLILYRSYRDLLFPNFLTAVTTAIGFFAIAFANIPLIRQYGLTVGFSIFICWLVVITALFPMLVLMPVPVVRKWTESPARWAIWLTNNKKRTIVVVSIIAIAFLWKGKHLNWSARLFDDLPKNQEARATTEFVDDHFGGMIPFEIMITANGDSPWNDPVALKKLDKLAEVWRRTDQIGSVMGPQDFLRAAGRVQGKDLPTTRQEAAEYNFLYAFSEGNPLKTFISADAQSARMNLRLHDIPADEMADLTKILTKQVQAEFPDAKVVPAGMATTVHELNNELSEELIFGFWQALVVICIILAISFRSLSWALVSIIPNLLPVVCLLGALSLGGIAIKPGIALIFSIALGISFDNTVYLLGRLRLLKLRSPTGKISVTKAWYQEGNLCFFSSVALSSGFLVFLASYFSLNQNFGIYMIVAIFGGLLGDLVLLPAMLAAFPWLVKDRKKPTKGVVAMSEKTVVAGIVALLLAGGGILHAAQVDPNNAKDLLKAVEKNMSAHDEVAKVSMIISEANGQKKPARVLEIKRKGAEGSQNVMVRMQSPADLKGVALLTKNNGKSSDQWLYMPSNKQTRRIVSSNKSSNFMDSELSFEDMGSASDLNVDSKVIKQDTINGRKFAVVENAIKGESTYSKILVWVDLATNLIAKTESYAKDGKLLKTTTFSGYKQFDKGVWRAQKVEVKNVQTKRGTVLELSDLKINKGLDDDEFSESAMTEGD